MYKVTLTFNNSGKTKTDYAVVYHEFHPNCMFSLKYGSGEVEYFNLSGIFSIKIHPAQ